MLVVFEGIDRSGKSTQCRRVHEHLLDRQTPVVALRYPDRTSAVTGAAIDNYLCGRTEMPLAAASLLLAANLWEMKTPIEQAIARGAIVLLDRYIWSNVAYSVARGMSERVFEQISAGLPRADLVVLMVASVETVAARSGFGDERFERADFQGRVATAIAAIAARTPDDAVLCIDAAADADAITQQILARLARLTLATALY